MDRIYVIPLFLMLMPLPYQKEKALKQAYLDAQVRDLNLMHLLEDVEKRAIYQVFRSQKVLHD
ncbi:MAG: hypothetical protein ACE5NG_17245 [bacterium]